MDGDEETYILLLLADSNLPTGSFVASSGLESYMKHGFANGVPNATIDFLTDSISNTARTALPFVSDAHRIIADYRNAQVGDDFGTDPPDLSATLASISSLDEEYHSMTLNQVTRRASQSQGVALLTLFSKGFAYPKDGPVLEGETKDTSRMTTLVDRYKLMIRREEVKGHLPICWAILTGALNLSLKRTQYLFLFLQARSILSAAVRLNEIGPYNSQQILLHVVRPLIDVEMDKCCHLTSRVFHQPNADILNGPANTWPLGEILSARHDLQHSRIFNS